MHLQKFIIYILFCFSMLQSQAQDTLAKPKRVPIVANWSLGDTLQYLTIKGLKRFENDQVKDSTATTTKITLVVADSTDSNYIIRIFQDPDLASIQSMGLSASDWDSLATIFEGLYLEYETSEMGEFKGFRNREKMYQGFSLIADRFVKTKMKDLTPTQQLRFAESMQVRKTQNFFEAKLSEDIKVMHKFYGLSFALDSTWHFEQIAPNPLDTTIKYPMPNTLFTSLPEEWDGLVRLENNILINNEHALSLIRSYIGEKQYEEIKQEYELNLPRYEIYCSYAFYPGDGVLESLHREVNLYFGEKLISQTFTDLYLQ